MKPNDLQAKVLGAIGKRLADKAESPAAGSHSGEFLCRVNYDITKAADYDTAPTVNILTKGIIAKALAMSGIQADNILKNICTVATEALLAGEKVVMSEADARVAAQMDKLFEEVIAKLPRQPRSGSLTGKVSVEIIPVTQSF